ncbi:hypothetical protein AB0M61_48715 [Streptomyces sp. NPDC051642]|uniref:hypothetical protein n=1 Tax=Streptomyces sp. NPDC051642 TaxID=3154646 RepID=UPI00343DAB76
MGGGGMRLLCLLVLDRVVPSSVFVFPHLQQNVVVGAAGTRAPDGEAPAGEPAAREYGRDVREACSGLGSEPFGG